MELREKLYGLRKEHRISQLEVAEKLGVSRQTVSRWETGTSVPTTANLAHLSKLYDVPLDVWMREEWTPSGIPSSEPAPEAQAIPDAPSEHDTHGTPPKPHFKWLKWGVPLAAFLLGIGFAVGMMFFLRQRERPVSTDEMESEVIDFSTISAEWPLLPPTE